MSDWQDNDEVVTNFQTIRLAQSQAAKFGFETAQEKILKELNEMLLVGFESSDIGYIWNKTIKQVIEKVEAITYE